MRYNLFMSDKDERKLQVIESTKTEAADETVRESSRQTNPIAGKFLKFHKENTGKFSVKDLFRK